MSRQLNTVLKLRRHAEDSAIRELAAAERHARAARLAVVTAKADAQRPVDGDDAPTFTVAHDLSARRQIVSRIAVEQSAAADAGTAAALAAYSAARVRTQMIERLLEKKAFEAHETSLIVAQRELDDASAAQWARNRA
jgi:flagellar biosynthesis chaperone FliJ